MRTNNLLKRVLLLTAFHGLIFGSSSCNYKRPRQTNSQEVSITEGASTVKSDNEDFDKFIEDFFKIDDFQFKRIIFPVSNLIYDTDFEKFDSTIIKKEDWKYWNVYKQNNVVLKTIKNDANDAILNAQIKETGVSVDYVFAVREGKWYLIKIIDEST